MNTRHVLFLILSVLILAACTPQTGDFKPEDLMVTGKIESMTGHPVLSLQVSADSKELLVDDPKNPWCRPHERAGCLYIRRSLRANIEFRLTDADINDDWIFTTFSICKGKKKPDPGKKCKIIRAERREFEASALKDSKDVANMNEEGIIDLTELNLPLKSFVIHDQNSKQQDYFYNIKACKLANLNKCVILDPVLRNKGR